MVCNEYEYVLDRCMYKIAKFIVAFGDVIIYLYRTQCNLHYQNLPDNNIFARNWQIQEMECLILHSNSLNFKYKMTNEQAKASVRVKIIHYKIKCNIHTHYFLAMGRFRCELTILRRKIVPSIANRI